MILKFVINTMLLRKIWTSKQHNLSTSHYYDNRYWWVESESCCRRNQQIRIQQEHRKAEKDV